MRAHPTDACSKLDPPPSNNLTRNWFVLADRSSSYNIRCSNREKVSFCRFAKITFNNNYEQWHLQIQHAAEAGYKVIILYSPHETYFQSSMTYYSLDRKDSYNFSYFISLELTGDLPFFHIFPIDSNTSIPAVLVSYEDGDQLEKKYQWQSGFKLYVTSDIPPNLSYYLLPFAIVIGVCLLLTISFMVRHSFLWLVNLY